MLELYFFPSPNCMKVTICLEEMALPYRLNPVDIAAGEQFSPAYLALCPNNKVPALVDHDPVDSAQNGPLELFESGAMLEYLAEKTGRFMPATLRERQVAKVWLYWQMAALGPMCGQANHFRAFAPEQVPYAVRRYTDEVNRLYGVLDDRLAGRDYVAGDYSITDMAMYPWLLHHERAGQNLADFPNIARWMATLEERPAVRRAHELGSEKLVSAERYRVLLNQTRETAARFRQAGSSGSTERSLRENER